MAKTTGLDEEMVKIKLTDVEGEGRRPIEVSIELRHCQTPLRTITEYRIIPVIDGHSLCWKWQVYWQQDGLCGWSWGAMEDDLTHNCLVGCKRAIMDDLKSNCIVHDPTLPDDDE